MQECTRAILLQEVARGAQLAAAADVKAGEMLDFGELARPLDFLGPGGYNNYLLVMAAASSVEDIKAWAGFINTRIKHLVNALHHSLRQIATARPWPQEIRVPMCAPVSASHLAPSSLRRRHRRRPGQQQAPCFTRSGAWRV